MRPLPCTWKLACASRLRIENKGALLFAAFCLRKVVKGLRVDKNNGQACRLVKY